MALPDSFIQELISRNDIESVVSSYIRMKRRGRNLVGLCPSMGKKTPSFTLYPDTESFYCFGCGAGGDVITFIKRIENLDYINAVRFLADRAGMKMPEDTRDDAVSRLVSADIGSQPGGGPLFPFLPLPRRERKVWSTITSGAIPITPSAISAWDTPRMISISCGIICAKRDTGTKSSPPLFCARRAPAGICTTFFAIG